MDNLTVEYLEAVELNPVMELLATPLIILFAGIIVAVARRSFAPAEQRLLVWGYFAHVVAAFAQVTITRAYYGSGDIMVYWLEGSALADALRQDFMDMAPRLVRVFLHEPTPLPFELYGAGSTGAQTAVSAFAQYVSGNSLYGSSVLFAMLAFLGKLGIYSAIKNEFSPEFRTRIGYAIVLLPSAVFWCGSLAKEGVAMAFFGFMIWALRNIAARRRMHLAIPVAAVSAVFVAMIKAYILIAFSLAAGVWVLWNSRRERNLAVVARPAYLLVGGLVAIGGMTLVARVNPEYSIDQVRERAAKQQAYGAQAGGGSYYALGSLEERSLAEQILLAPAGLFTSLFRPLVFEARSMMVFINSLETTALLFLVLSAVRRLGLGGVMRLVVGSPALMFCAVFAVAFGSMIGVVSTNLGTLSRYRVPMMPFFAVLVATLHLEAAAPRRLRRRTAGAAPTPQGGALAP